ncbi:hypothetical protein C8R44DRAFT_818614 [Mycena epipterygia]|nr:hypothetical protein C8R44DRAFT_818614 [Mycena epipterygia]
MKSHPTSLPLASTAPVSACHTRTTIPPLLTSCSGLHFTLQRVLRLHTGPRVHTLPHCVTAHASG